MLPNSRVVKLLSGIFGAMPSFCLSIPVVMLLLISASTWGNSCEPVDDSCFGFDPSFVIVGLSSLYGTAALWMVLFDTNTVNRLRRILTALGLVAGVAAATLTLVGFFTSGFGLNVLTLGLLSCLSVGSYHLIRVVQLEWRSRSNFRKT